MYFSEYTWAFWLSLHKITEHKSISATPSIPMTENRLTSCLFDLRDLLSLWSVCVKGVRVIPCNALSFSFLLICAYHHRIRNTIIRIMIYNTQLVPFNLQNPGNLNGCHGCCLSVSVLF